jgi:Glyoxalase-like domain
MAEQAMWVSRDRVGAAAGAGGNGAGSRRGRCLAIEAGARPAGVQPREHTRVMLDPAGHPFCLYPG